MAVPELKSLGIDGHIRALSASTSMIRALECHQGAGHDARAARRLRFYLASIDPKSWLPRVIAVRVGSSAGGYLFAKERQLHGVPTGLIYADLSSGIVASERSCAMAVLDAALRHLWRTEGVRGLRLHAEPGSIEMCAVERVSRELQVNMQNVSSSHHAVLSLSESYDEFLAGLGQRTRRNLRYYRRRAEALGHCFVQALDLDEFGRAAHHLHKRMVVGGGDWRGLQRGLRMLSHAERPLLAGLRDKNGEWISILGGWEEDGDAWVFCQMNNERDHAKLSLSTVLRGHVIETLIQQGFRNLFFWAGCAGSFAPYCRTLPTSFVYLDSNSLRWRAVRGLAKASRFFLPNRMSRLTEWVSPKAI
jgi:hypothetical protein